MSIFKPFALAATRSAERDFSSGQPKMLLAQHPQPRRRNTTELRKKFLLETECFLAGELRLHPPRARYFPKAGQSRQRLFGRG